MKRAKIVLAGVALFAVIGGAFAFKASRVPQPLFTENAAGICNVPTTLFLTLTPPTPGQLPITTTDLYYTTRLTTSCPLTTWYTIN
ncbi:hypothetical protein SAMN05421841_1820 [Chryseobacterium wanjuense]|uniref:Uncharacterized protein n=1 Tax=Chryseobacterium wanjuense TaxID=356305 RepID=A0A1I0QCP8_9FLAO|nr:hypothetical protein [Chryseobacterium wanjuense]SEW24827.1 hypothetical protein SAMN05421841_1820 [Chryseobacterium wanjuense]